MPPHKTAEQRAEAERADTARASMLERPEASTNPRGVYGLGQRVTKDANDLVAFKREIADELIALKHDVFARFDRLERERWVGRVVAVGVLVIAGNIVARWFQ